MTKSTKRSPAAQAIWRAFTDATVDSINQDAETIRAKNAEIERLKRALHEIAEEWAGAECGQPVTCQEGYAIQLARRMYDMASAALSQSEKP